MAADHPLFNIGKFTYILGDNCFDIHEFNPDGLDDEMTTLSSK